ncbi:hypothetical protein [Methylobacterium planeticum]|uniref:Uncharacterized protein n=1 Tax=Methylobacterium planeticum TaxID=2615211 RepID=A0A6N6MT46_9HYPH|nr:hypothetical protein [Methylobacterium planeticum]KAB1073715.1 hypothetical protein F6X51_11035 [Methylobacterium planeticum]
MADALGIDESSVISAGDGPATSSDPALASPSPDQRAAKDKQLLDSLRLLKAFLAIDDESARLKVLEFAESVSRRDADTHTRS